MYKVSGPKNDPSETPTSFEQQRTTPRNRGREKQKNRETEKQKKRGTKEQKNMGPVKVHRRISCVCQYVYHRASCVYHLV